MGEINIELQRNLGQFVWFDLYLELSRGCNLDWAWSLSTLATDGLNFLDNVHTLDNRAENNVLNKS